MKLKKLYINLICGVIPWKEKRRAVRDILRTPSAQQKEQPTIHPDWLGRHSYTGGNFIRMNSGTKIGAFCSIGQNVAVGPSQHPTDWLSTAPFQYVDFKKITKEQKLYPYSNAPTFVGNDVWIGNNVIIKDGITVADGCIIGSNAVVTHNTEPYGIYAGVPAKLIRYRFSREIIDELLELQWWNLSDEQIAQLPFNDIDKCIAKIKAIKQKQ